MRSYFGLMSKRHIIVKTSFRLNHNDLSQAIYQTQTAFLFQLNCRITLASFCCGPGLIYTIYRIHVRANGKGLSSPFKDLSIPTSVSVISMWLLWTWNVYSKEKSLYFEVVLKADLGTTVWFSRVHFIYQMFFFRLSCRGYGIWLTSPTEF